jgi:protoheme IX farnesyltransferase
VTTEAIAGPLHPTSVRVGWRDYVNLTKPTITLLVVITSIPGALLATNSLTEGLLATLYVMLGSGLASASAAVFNQLVEQESDSVMNRTSQRSLPTGRVSTRAATIFGTVIGVIGIGILYQFTTPLAALVALAGHAFYVLFYTMYLKRRTVQNIVIGGAAGAVGPLIGWAAVTGTLSGTAWMMFLLIFLWTPPHFWSLALKYKDDYSRAGIPMYPTIHGDEKTRLWIAIYSWSLLPCLVGTYFFGDIGVSSLVIGLALTAKFIIDATKLYLSHTNDTAMPLFFYSCVYTLAIFLVYAVERVIVLSV